MNHTPSSPPRRAARPLVAAALALTLLAGPARAASPVHAVVTAGTGFGELLHVQAGWQALERLTVEARFGFVILNPLVGLGVNGYLFGDAEPGRPPTHSLMLSGQLMVNPTLGALRIDSGADRLAASAGVYAGYALFADFGLHVRALAGVFLYSDSGPAAAPNFQLGVGWAF